MANDPIDRLLAHPPDLPVAAALPELTAALAARGVAVVQAPPGTGKTTLVPPAVAGAVEGTVVVTQPRRVAARAAARRLAYLLGEPVGRTIGYAVRGERRTSAATRIEVVTTGVLLRRLQRDPELPGVGALVLDEIHERHLDADLTLALAVDVRANLREDLSLVAMSATVEAERTATLLGDGEPTPVVAANAVLHPVQTRWCPPPAPPIDERGVTPTFLDHVAGVVRRALAEEDGDVLVFLPGAGEVEAVARRLGGLGVDVRPLHGRLAPRDQDRALTPGPGRKVVLSTAVAESSLTVPGVRVVVDAGLSREPRTDHRRGLAGLVTVAVSRAAAQQRAGRAGREGPGVVYRCWSELDHARLRPHPLPEIATADLAGFALELACWGSPDGDRLALLDPPPAGPMAAARRTLVALGAVREDGTVTPRGRAIAAAGTDPRLGRALLDGAPLVGAKRAAEVVAMLAEDVRAEGADLLAALRRLRRGGSETHRWAREVARYERVARGGGPSQGDGAGRDRRADGSGRDAPSDGSGRDAPSEGSGRDAPSDGADGRSDGADALTDDLAAGLVVALAHPDRVARLRPGGRGYLMTSGTGAALPPGSSLTGLAWLAVADADRTPGRREAVIRSAAPLEEDLALEAAAPLLAEEDVVAWSDGTLVARRTLRLGAIELSAAPLTDPPPHLVVAAVRDGLARDGLQILPWTDVARELRHRLAFLHRTLGDPWPDVSDEALVERLDAWLGPDLATVRSAQHLTRIDVLAALRRLLPWPAAGRLDELAPVRMTVPSGSAVRVSYDGDQPVLAVRLQEALGWRETPKVAGGRVPVLVHLLSPARRTLAVTADLESFWQTAYPQVRAEMRGRYPKHDWPEDPLRAQPHRGVRRR